LTSEICLVEMFEDPIGRINRNLEAWEAGLKDPQRAQLKVLQDLIVGYS
jgi:hypothetical protein